MSVEPQTFIWEVAAQIATAFAVVVAVVGLVWQIIATYRDRQQRNSAFRLDSALYAFNQASELLSDGNNDRVTWIAASRAVERGLRIAEGIACQEHQDLYEVRLDRYRQIFGDFLGYDNPEKSAVFFYGDTTGVRDIDDAAVRSTQRIDGLPKLLSIPEPTLRVIFLFAQFPENYEDPISRDKRFSGDEVHDAATRTLWPGLIGYIRHLRRDVSVTGTLQENNRRDA